MFPKHSSFTIMFCLPNKDQVVAIATEGMFSPAMELSGAETASLSQVARILAPGSSRESMVPVTLPSPLHPISVHCACEKSLQDRWHGNITESVEYLKERLSKAAGDLLRARKSQEQDCPPGQ